MSVEGETVGAVSGPSLAVLVGVGREDTEEQVEWLARKLLNMRLWAGDDEKPWARSVRDMGGSVLVVSQFTLHGKLKGNKPDWGRGACARTSLLACAHVLIRVTWHTQALTHTRAREHAYACATVACTGAPSIAHACILPCVQPLAPSLRAHSTSRCSRGYARTWVKSAWLQAFLGP